MLFNSLTFVVFFAVVVTLYWSIRSWNARKNLLVTASYIFYGAWNPPFAALLFPPPRWIFGWADKLPKRKTNPRVARGWLPASA
jgi:alginate O-acetyltransferase complex protein AlgI